jgi:uncharacterized DUF497 family protein
VVWREILKLLESPHLIQEELERRLRRNCGERRLQTVGFLAGRMVMVVWTPRGEARHVISMRKCNVKEQARYRQRFAEG